MTTLISEGDNFTFYGSDKIISHEEVVKKLQTLPKVFGDNVNLRVLISNKVSFKKYFRIIEFIKQYSKNKNINYTVSVYYIKNIESFDQTKINTSDELHLEFPR